LPAGVYYSTLEVHVNFVRALRANMGEVRCEAEIIHVGRTTATAQARLVDSEGKLYAHSTTTCIIFRPDGE
ncbi:MAG: hotdog fold thioesterase, partial [Anaerolineae bacterium]